MPGRKPGTWKCQECQRWCQPYHNFCPGCGADQPKKGARRSVTGAKHDPGNKRERATGLSSQQLREGKRGKKARGESLRNSPLASSIDDAVRKRTLDRRDRENAEAVARGDEPWERGHDI